MKLIKNRLFQYILIAIVFTSIGVYAANITAEQISYSNNKTVKDAIDDLYSSLDRNNCINDSFTVTNDDITNGKKVFDTEPSLIIIFNSSNNSNDSSTIAMHYYNKNFDSNNEYFLYDSNTIKYSITSDNPPYTINNGVYINPASGWLGRNIYYTICK